MSISRRSRLLDWARARPGEMAHQATPPRSLHAVALGGCLAGLAVVMALGSRAHSEGQPGREIVVWIPGVPGPYCVYGIDKRVRELSGVQRVDFLWPQEKIRIVLAPESRVTSADSCWP